MLHTAVSLIGLARAALDQAWAHAREGVQSRECRAVDLRNNPVVSIDEHDINVEPGHHGLDVVIYATGFDAGIGACNQVDIRGGDERSLRNGWKTAVPTTVGMKVWGGPNMLMTMSPFAPSSAI